MASERWTPAIAQAADRRHAMLDTTDQVKQLRIALGDYKKAELIDALTEFAENDRAILRALQARFGDNGSPDQLVIATRQAILDATRVDEHRRNYNFDYDYRAYESIQRNLTLLTEQELFDTSMELSLELMSKGSYQIECSDEGLMTDEIEACINVVIVALRDSSLSAKQVTEWCDAMGCKDAIGCISNRELALLRKQFEE